MATCSSSKPDESDDFSEPAVSIGKEEGVNVSVFLKIRGLKAKSIGFFARFRRSKATPHPGSLTKNAEFTVWELTTTSFKMVLKVHSELANGNKKKQPQSPPEFFRYEIHEFPCPILLESTTYEVKEARSSGFLCLNFKKSEPTVSWMNFQRQQGTLDAYAGK